MMTGLYPHSSGAIDNEHTYDPGLPTIAAILDSVGYHTAMIGKYDAYNTPQPGWDYWMAEASSTTYSNPKFNINGYTKTLFGNTTQIIIDSSDKILSTIDTPFFMIIAHQAPHKKVVPLPADEGMYASEQMPFPPNFFPYTDLYPSFLDDHAQYHDSAGVETDLENYYEGIQGIETNVTDIFDVLTARNLLNNTMMLFTADNGYLYGEHLLVGKGLPLEPSIKLPMFIRYPAWFATNTVVADPMVLQTDVAPSILEAAGINPAPYHFQGFSMHKLAKGHAKRDMILYENIKYATQEDPITPSLRTLRTAHYKYNRYQCTEKDRGIF
jgi:arylsulfatase A-like enzyme